MGHSRRGTHWEFFSPRLGQRVVASSSLEYEHYVLVECDPTILSYEVQVKITEEVGGKRRTSVLDSLVRYRDGRCAVNEVKFEAQVAEAERQFEIQRAWARRNGYSHHVLTEKEIRGDALYLANCHAMLPWARPLHAPSDDIKTLVIGFIAGRDDRYSIEDVAARTGVPLDCVVPVVVGEYFDGRISIPNLRTHKFGRKTLVGRAD